MSVAIEKAELLADSFTEGDRGQSLTNSGMRFTYAPSLDCDQRGRLDAQYLRRS